MPRTPTTPRAARARRVSTSSGGGKAPRTRAQRDVRRDSFDYRDLIYQPALLELAPRLLPDWKCVRILDQKNEGACTGFGLAAVINYLNRRGGVKEEVSARMLFELAKRYDQWPGQNYDYSSARGAMRAWHKHGVCAEKLWPNHPGPNVPNTLTWERQNASLSHVLGSYFRVLPRRSDVHAALSEVGVLYAAADTHDGWDAPDAKGRIVFKPADGSGGGGHAFAIVGYTAEGFLVQNSWGASWGGWVDERGTRRGGIALWSYADFDQNVWDLWVVRKALPVESIAALTGGHYTSGPSGTRETEDAPPAHVIWNHYVHIDDGQFDPQGDYPSSAAETRAIARRLVRGVDGPPPRHILLYAHGGLNSVAGSARRTAKWRPVFKANGIAELHFIWETGFLAELRDILLGKEDFAKQRVARDSSWWDRFLEKAVQPLGVPLWREMRDDAQLAFRTPDNAGSATMAALAAELAAVGAAAPRLHLAAHSAGSVLFGHLLAAAGAPPVENLILFAPACTVDFFQAAIRPALQAEKLRRLHHFHLDDRREQDDNVGKVYRKSLLYLVANALEDRKRTVDILGMEKFWNPLYEKLPAELRARIAAFNPRDHGQRTSSNSHGGFDNDVPTMNSLLEIVLGGKPPRPFKPEDMVGY